MIKYQDQNVTKIKVDPDDFRSLAFNGIEGFKQADLVEGESYKDSAPTKTILHRLSDDTFWAFNWYQYTSHYGNGDHMFYDPYLYEVGKHTEVVSRTVVTWTPAKE